MQFRMNISDVQTCIEIHLNIRIFINGTCHIEFKNTIIISQCDFYVTIKFIKKWYNV